MHIKAVICKNAELKVEELPEVEPAKGQAVLDVLRCGICGSDLHVRHHCEHMGNMYSSLGYKNFASVDEPLVFGHEFCGEVLDYGPSTKGKFKPGTRVCALPLRRQGKDVDMIGFSSRSHGAYAERIVADESMMVRVPNGLSADMAALTEPMAVGWHAVRRAEVRKKDVSIVIGCGPVGLAVICMLKASGVQIVVAADFSAGRRKMAEQCGADVVINPAEESPYSNWEGHGFIDSLAVFLDKVVDIQETFAKLPIPWWHTWRLAEKLGFSPNRPVIFECVGVPGLVNQIMSSAPLGSRIVVAGLCMETDSIEPVIGIFKEIDIRFVMGYTPLEYRDTLHMIAEGKVNCAPMITGVVGLEGVDNAFTVLGDPEKHAKILIDPKSTHVEPVSA